jgi:hypothetical protein
MECLRIARGDHASFSATCPRQNGLTDGLHPPRFFLRVDPIGTLGPVQADMTPFSASIAPRSSDPRFRPSWPVGHGGLALRQVEEEYMLEPLFTGTA